MTDDSGESQEEWVDPRVEARREQAEYEEENQQEAPPSWFYMFQVLVVPLIIILAVVMMFLGVQWLFSKTEDPERLIQQFENGSPREREQAVVSLSRMMRSDPAFLDRLRGREEVKRTMLRVFQEAEDHQVDKKLQAVQFLNILEFEEAVPHLHRALERTGRSRLKIAILRALGSIGNPRSLAYIRPHLDDPDPGIRQATVHGLAGIKTRETIPTLEKALEDDIMHIRLAAAVGLATHPLREEIPREKIKNVVLPLLDAEHVRNQKQPNENGQMVDLSEEDVYGVLRGALRVVRLLKVTEAIDKISAINQTYELRTQARKTLSQLRDQQEQRD